MSKKILQSLLFASLLWGLPRSALSKTPLKPHHSAQASMFSCAQYVRNYDGDTLTVDLNAKGLSEVFSKSIGVRVRGIDTPEMNSRDNCAKQLARKAKQLVKSLCAKAKCIKLENVERGKYFRLVADVKCDEKSLAKELVARGWATTYLGKGARPKFYCPTGVAPSKPQRKVK